MGTAAKPKMVMPPSEWHCLAEVSASYDCFLVMCYFHYLIADFCDKL